MSTLQINAGVLSLQGDFTHATVARHLAAANFLTLTAAATQVDLSAVGQVDSSALGLLLTIKRRAVAQGRSVEMIHWPVGLIDLARLYGVFELF
ncbi:MAG: STAS domain-containing protein [Betaproteobacteria bacterium]|jgi:ABC-type transporter Mla MlaB component|nr:MAG: STAS domain-containing protein [Betaproteobacteria bacterium]